MRFFLPRTVICLLVGVCVQGLGWGAEDRLPVGVAQVDITPDYSVRLSGFGFRRDESEGITQRIWAKALAFGDEQEGPAIIIATDNLGVSDDIADEVAGRLARRTGLKRHRLAITATHTHTAPMLTGVAPTLFGVAIPAEHQRSIDRYTREFVDKLEAVALAAVADIRPARVEWTIGTVGFAANRRTKGGPVDHDLPVLIVRDEQNQPRAIYFSYACHCVTLSHNHISGDWAGYAAESVQEQFPGAIALASVGCGADANPSSGVTGDKVELAADQGRQIATEIKRLLTGHWVVLARGPVARWETVDLAFAAPRTRGEWDERAARQDAVGYHARANLARLDGGEQLPGKVVYPIQTWVFGEGLAMVFLPGEVVVDYSLRLKREFDRQRLWINAYANDSPCYIPSERVLREGGYEGSDAMIYYDQPQKFAPGLEQKIIDVIHRQVPESYRAAPGTEGSAPKSPEDSLGTIRVKLGLEVELVAGEPLVSSPVAIDWGADGRLWVCEMFDYPMGVDGGWQPGGRVRFLEDTNGDGVYDRSVVFLDGLLFPTGVMAWGNGVLVCAAPDILLAEDDDGDGRPDRVQKLFTGFSTENYQARVNSLSLGLDNWIYGANGLLGGIISHGTERLDIRGHDVRFKISSRSMDLVSGLTQQGRARDDWGNWFGCDNGNAVFYYPHEARYFRRNPHVAAPAATVSPQADFDPGRVYPISRLLERFNDPDQANRLTSACGLGFYRDVWLGEEFYGNTFTCEPVHNLVHRLILQQEGRVRHRAVEEQQAEFLASTDNWFRPVQARTGPDGALYVVDMYRFLIEHPRWISPARLTQLDVRAGSERGRIYRVRVAGKPLRPVQDLTQLDGSELVAVLDTPNGTERDRVHLELLRRREMGGVHALSQMSRSSGLPQTRVQALSVLAGLESLGPETLRVAFRDLDDRVRRHAVRLSEGVAVNEGLAVSLLGMVQDGSASVREQLALTLGEWQDPRAGEALAKLATEHSADATLRAAILSSARPHALPILEALLKADLDPGVRSSWVAPMIATIAGGEDGRQLGETLRLVLLDRTTTEAAKFRAVAALLTALERRGTTWLAYSGAHPEARDLDPLLEGLVTAARTGARGGSEEVRDAAIDLLGSHLRGKGAAVVLWELFKAEGSDRARAALLAALRRQRGPETAQVLLADWGSLSPRARGEVMGLVLERDEWISVLLAAIDEGRVAAREISLADRRRLLDSSEERIRRLAAGIWADSVAGQRSEVVARYQDSLSLTGQAVRGEELFAQHCASCHALGGLGHAVGPDLEPLRGKEASYWLQNILDPNAVVEPRFVSYEASTRDDRTMSGIIKDETATTLTLVAGNGIQETVLKSELSELRALTLSLMPEGLEEGLPPQAMADLLVYLRRPTPAKRVAPSHVAPRWTVPAVPSNGLLRDPVSIARFLLDERQSREAREAAIAANPQFAGKFIAEMTRELAPGGEYARIPWIWRVAVACGKRNDQVQIRELLSVSLPGLEEPLRDWQAVVLGGGIIQGISERGVWPGRRVEEILGEGSELTERWNRALNLSAIMADNERIPAGTRYDALRMLGVEPWAKSGRQISRYLAAGINPELQMGAVSALGDMPGAEAGLALRGALDGLTTSNRELALLAFMRDDERAALLAGQSFSPEIRAQLAKLADHSNATVRERVQKLLKQ